MDTCTCGGKLAAVNGTVACLACGRQPSPISPPPHGKRGVADPVVALALRPKANQPPTIRPGDAFLRPASADMARGMASAALSGEQLAREYERLDALPSVLEAASTAGDSTTGPPAKPQPAGKKR